MSRFFLFSFVVVVSKFVFAFVQPQKSWSPRCSLLCSRDDPFLFLLHHRRRRRRRRRRRLNVFFPSCVPLVSTRNGETRRFRGLSCSRRWPSATFLRLSFSFFFSTLGGDAGGEEEEGGGGYSISVVWCEEISSPKSSSSTIT